MTFYSAVKLQNALLHTVFWFKIKKIELVQVDYWIIMVVCLINKSVLGVEPKQSATRWDNILLISLV